MEEVFEVLKEAQIGQTVYVTVTGRQYYPGVILGYGYYDYYPNKLSYKVMVYRKDNHRFVEYLTWFMRRSGTSRKGLDIHSADNNRVPDM